MNWMTDFVKVAKKEKTMINIVNEYEHIQEEKVYFIDGRYYCCEEDEDEDQEWNS